MSNSTPSNASPVAQFASLSEVVVSGRRIHEKLLESALETHETQGTCFYACLLLQESINRFTAFRAVIRGGDGLTSGFRDPRGDLQGHYWIEVEPKPGHADNCETADTLVVDITGDQFGTAPVVMVPLSASIGRYLAGDQAEIDEHVRLFGLPEGPTSAAG